MKSIFPKPDAAQIARGAKGLAAKALAWEAWLACENWAGENWGTGCAQGPDLSRTSFERWWEGR